MTQLKFTHQYESLLNEAMSQAPEVNQRTKAKVRTIPHPVHIHLAMHDGKLPVAGNRAYYPAVAAAEAAWQTLGTTDPQFIMEHAPKLWSKFLDKNGRLPTAYGYRWSKEFGRDQIRLAINALREDPSNRQIWVQAWDPRHDGLGEPDQPLNIPCPVGFSLTVTEKRLNMAVFIRSSDLFVGLPYDVMGYALTLDMLATELNLAPGYLTFTLAHAHIYDAHWAAAAFTTGSMEFHGGRSKPTYGEAVELCKRLDIPLSNSPEDTLRRLGNWGHFTDIEPNLPVWSWSEVQQNPTAYVQQVKKLSARVGKHEWAYKPEVVI